MNNLICTNPNYIILEVNGDDKKSKITFITRDHFLQTTDNFMFTKHITRCNKCLSCRLYKSYQWANRLTAQKLTSNYTYFITLTFNDHTIYMADGSMRPIQLFIKRLRKKYKDFDIKYYATHELGGETLRGHYHMILYTSEDIFGLDKYPFKYNKDKLFISKTLQDLWKYGSAPFTYANYDMIRYTANYVQDSKLSLKHSYSKDLGGQFIKKNLDPLTNTYLIGGNYSRVPKKYEQDRVITTLKERIQRELRMTIIRDTQDIRAYEIKKQFFRKKT